LGSVNVACEHVVRIICSISCRVGQMKIILTIVASVTAVIGILLVVFGALATGATRRNVYSGAKCILGGRCSAVFV